METHCKHKASQKSCRICS